MQAFQQGVTWDVGQIERHDRPPSASKGSAVLARVQALRFALALRAPAAAWTRAPRGAAVAVADGRSSESCSLREIDPPGCSRNDDRPSGRPVLFPSIGTGVVTASAQK